MQHLFQSTFLQALGYAIANSLWQTALVWLVYMSVTGLLSVSSAAKYRLAVIAQLTGFVWFIITFQFYYRQYSEAWQHSGVVPVAQNIQTILAPGTDLSSKLINWMVKGEQLLPYVSMAYLLLMLFLCLRWFMGYRQTQMIRNNGLQKMPADWILFVKKIALQLGIKKEIRLFLSDTVTTPLTIGFLKPVILVPIASINHLTTDQLEAVLLHEMAHIKRYDYLVNIILSVVEIGLFFNPFTQLLSKNIRKERENSCDDWVLQFKYNASVYAEALLRIAYLQTSPAFAMAASGKKKNDLLMRIKRLIDKKENRFSYRKQLLAFVIVTGILSSIAWLNPMAPHTEKKPLAGVKNKTQVLQKQPQHYAVEPMAVSVDNPLFNPVFFLSKPLKAEMKKNMASAQKEIDALVNDQEIKEADQFIQSLPPMITDALEKASIEMKADHSEWKKEIAQMENAKIDMEKAFRSDTFQRSLKMGRKKLSTDLNSSLKNWDVDIKKAREEMERSFNTADIPYVDKQKLKQDIEKGMEAVEQFKQMGFDKLVLNALRIPGMMMDENSLPRTMVPAKIMLPSQKWQLDKNHKKRNVNDKDAPAIQRTEKNAPDDLNEELNTKEMKSIRVMILPRLAELGKIQIDLAMLTKIKAVMLREDGNNIKIIPLVAKEKVNAVDETKNKEMILQLQ